MNALATMPADPHARAGAGDLRVRGFASGDQERWDRFVLQCPQATFFHRAGWRDIIENVFRHRCHYLLAEDAHGLLGELAGAFEGCEDHSRCAVADERAVVQV